MIGVGIKPTIPSVSGSYSPAQEGNAVLWLHGDRGVTQAGGRASAWENQLPNGSTYGFDSANATYQPGVSTSNGHQVLTGDGANQGIMLGRAGTKGMTRNTNAFTLYMVWQATGTGVSQQAFLATNNAGLGRCTLSKSAANRDVLAGRRLDGDSSANATPGTDMGTSPIITCAIWDYANSDAFIYRNNVLVASNTSFQTAGSTSDTDSANVVLMAAGNGVVSLNGWIGEVWCFRAAHTNSTVRTNVTQYLSTGWTISI